MSRPESGPHGHDLDPGRMARAGLPRARRDLVVFCHLRWDFVFQRPQHLLTRLAARWRVWFVEEPVDAPSPAWSFSEPAPGVTVCRPGGPGLTCGFTEPALPTLRRLVAGLVHERRIRRPVAWHYTPLAAPLAAELDPAVVVYDCMDELSAFLHAPPELIARERELLAMADVVFTGGPSLHRAKQARHREVHCFPSSVDVAHFAAARNGCREAADQSGLPRPRLGFFGVIDERLDLGLLDAVAAARPDWQLVLVGPVVKVDPATLPRRPNIVYTGMRAYGDLPSYVCGWDACLLPFARNEATRFISPTKTLEYMAAERPIVSTPIRDVAEPYGHIVYVAGDPDAFIRACATALASSALEREGRAARMRAVLRATSWDDTAARMHAIVDRHLHASRAARRVREESLPC